MAYNNNYQNNQGGYPQRRSTGAPRNSSPRTQQREPQEQSTGPTLYNDRAGKFLNFNYWGRYASVEIGIVQPGSTMNWDARKNAQKVTQVIAFENLSEIWDICEEVLDSLKNTGTFTSAGIRVGMKQDAMIEINNGSTINMAPGIYLVIYKNLDSGNRTNNLEIYPFEDVRIVRGYDHSSGMAKDDINKVGQFKKFYRLVKEAAKAFTMAQVHALQVVTKSDRLGTFKALTSISQALGVDISSELNKFSSNSNKGNNNNGGGGYNHHSGGGYNAPRGNWQSSGSPRSATFESSTDSYKTQQQIMSTLDDPVDINLSMESLTNVDMSQFK